MRNGRMQCKDIPDAPILSLLANLPPYPGQIEPRAWGNLYFDDDASVTRAMPAETPPKVVLGKMRMLMRRGLVEGCGCGCRGDFELTDKGRAALHTNTGEKT
jgi:hypothetical protein